MLMVLRIVFPAPLTPGAVRSFGRVVLLPPGVEGRLDADGARSPLFGNPKLSEAFRVAMVGTIPVLFRVFVVGSAGRAVVGGPYEGLEGLGIEAAMTNECVAGCGRLAKRYKIYRRVGSLPRSHYLRCKILRVHETWDYRVLKITECLI